jgi:hypothetical protein
VSTTAETPVDLRCSGCGDTFRLSARRARDWQDRDPLCRRCRTPARELTPAEQERYRKWWLDRYSLEELFEIGLAFWPDLAPLASGRP